MRLPLNYLKAEQWRPPVLINSHQQNVAKREFSILKLKGAIDQSLFRQSAKISPAITAVNVE
ncbi:hypothetical protein [Rubritalea sp.]|uniref:hypothetical protein n=1 Tax=Rubritalea sp. TaxID=2109375 RepID=UPI0032424709